MSSQYNLSKLKNSQNNQNRQNLQIPVEISDDSNTNNLLRASHEFEFIRNENESLQMVIEEMKTEMEKTVMEVRTMRQEIQLHKNDNLYLKNENNEFKKDTQEYKNQIAQLTHQINTKDLQINENLDQMKNYHQEALDNRNQLNGAEEKHKDVLAKLEAENEQLNIDINSMIEDRESLLETLAKLKAKAKKWDENAFRSQNENPANNQVDLQQAELDELRIRNDKLNVAYDQKNKECERVRKNLNSKMFTNRGIPGQTKKDSNQKLDKSETEKSPNKTQPKNTPGTDSNMTFMKGPKLPRNYNLKDDEEFNKAQQDDLSDN